MPRQASSKTADTKMKTVIKEADLNNKIHQNAIKTLINQYVLDLQGYNKQLESSVLDELIPGLKRMPTSMIFLAQVKSDFVGMAVCFWGFSTFYARPIINIHDFTVRKDFRNNGIGTALIQAVETKAKTLECCKLTLEVQETNVIAMNLYQKTGFMKSIGNDSDERVFFLSKHLS